MFRDIRHPHYSHLTRRQIDLFCAFLSMPNEYFEFNTENWTIQSKSGIITIEFTLATTYLAFVTSLLGRSLTVESRLLGARAAQGLLSLGPEHVERYCSFEKVEKVNWQRDGF